MNKNFFAGLFIGLGLLAIVAFKPAAEKPDAAVQKWEYLDVSLPQSEDKRQAKTNEYGSQGWELVAMDGAFGFHRVFKRPVQ
jgi:hypothetical protein